MTIRRSEPAWGLRRAMGRVVAILVMAPTLGYSQEPAEAQAALAFQVGQVVLIASDRPVPLMEGERIVQGDARQEFPSPWEILAVDGLRLRVRGGIRGNTGWVQSSQVETLDQCIARCQGALRRDSKDGRALERLYRARLMNHQPEVATAELDETIRLHPDWSDAYRARSHVWMVRHDLDKAIADQMAAIRCEPDRAEDYLSRGLLYQEKGSLDLALDDYTTAARLASPPRASFHLMRAELLVRMSRFEEAAEAYGDAIRAEPERAAGSYSARAVLDGTIRARESSGGLQ